MRAQRWFTVGGLLFWCACCCCVAPLCTTALRSNGGDLQAVLSGAPRCHREVSERVQASEYEETSPLMTCGSVLGGMESAEEAPLPAMQALRDGGRAGGGQGQGGGGVKRMDTHGDEDGRAGGGWNTSPMAVDTPARRGSEDTANMGMAPRKISFESPEPSDEDRNKPGRSMCEESSADCLINSPLLHTPLPKGRHGQRFRSPENDDDDGDQNADERVNKFAFSSTSPIAALPKSSAGRAKMSRRLTSTPSFGRDFFDIREVGRGEHGHVYRCVRKIDLWPYAVKVLPKCMGARDRESALQEIYALAAQGDNPHAVRYYNSWEEDDVIYIQTELCLGTVFQKWKESKAPLPPGEIAQVLLHAAAGLRYMHDHGVVHTDVKPENIYIAPSGLLKLGDFGLARDMAVGAGSDEDEDGDRRYLAPEALDQGQGGTSADASASDMYALGASAYELASARRLPEAGPEYQALRQSRPPPPPGLPKALGDAISSLMDPDPKKRPTAAQLVDDDGVNAELSSDVVWGSPFKGRGNRGGLVSNEALEARMRAKDAELASSRESMRELRSQVEYWKSRAGGQ